MENNNKIEISSHASFLDFVSIKILFVQAHEFPIKKAHRTTSDNINNIMFDLERDSKMGQDDVSEQFEKLSDL